MLRSPARSRAAHRRSPALLRSERRARFFASEVGAWLRRRRGRRARLRARSACSRSCAASRSPARRSATSARRGDRGRSWSGSTRCGASSRSALAARRRDRAARHPRPRGRDLATGIVLGAGARARGAVPLPRHDLATTRPAPSITILFGSLFAIATLDDPGSSSCSAWSRSASSSLLYRPLLLSSLSPELAAARGVPVRLVGARLPPRAGARGRARGADDRRDPQHRAADRSRRDRAAADQAARPRDRSPPA